MIPRAALLLGLFLPIAALAQNQPPPSQLDRIEGKLDELLRRLEPHPAQLSGAQAPTPGAANPSPAPPPASAPEALKSGALAVARAAPENERGLADIPADSVGGFAYTGGPIPLSDIKRNGVRYAGPVSVELQGWLRAKEAGRYQLGVDLAARLTPTSFIAPTCRLQAWLEGQSLGERTAQLGSSLKQENSTSLVLGTELQPGLYRLRVWISCTARPGVATTAELLLKAPSELNLRPTTADDLLHKTG